MQRGVSLLALLACFFMTNAVAAVSPPSGELTSRTYEAQQLLDQYYGDSDDIARAEEILNEVVGKNPDFVPAHIQGARLILMGGHIVSAEFTSGTLEAARALLLRARRLEPKNPEVYVLLGHLHRLEEDTAAALDVLNTARELNSKNPWMNNNFGDVFFDLGDWSKADDHYKLVEAPGSGSTPQQRRAFTYALTKRQQVAAYREDNEAVKRFGKLATSSAAAEDAWTWGDVGNVLFVQGFFDEAIQNSRKALSIMSYGVGRQNLALGLYGKWAQMKSVGLDADAEQYFVEANSLLPLVPNMVLVQERFQSSAEVVFKLTPIVRKRVSDLQNNR